MRTGARVCAVGLLAWTAAAESQQPERAFTSNACHVTFRYPNDWTVVADTTRSEVPCHILLRPTGWDSLFVLADSIEHSFEITIKIMASRFEDAWMDSPFERRDSGWVVGGRLGLENRATPIAQRGWQGVRGDAPFGCYRMGGGYAGACEWPTALVGAGGYSAYIEGAANVSDVFERLLETLAFRSPAGPLSQVSRIVRKQLPAKNLAVLNQALQAKGLDGLTATATGKTADRRRIGTLPNPR
jgi:hypothetical protein